MASQYKKVKRYAGVYYSESKVNKFRGKADRTYWINFRESDTRKLIWERCGKASDGWTPEAAQKKRMEILEKHRVDKYKPKSQRRKETITVEEYFKDHFLKSRNTERQKTDATSRFKNWISDYIGSKKLTEVTSGDIDTILSAMSEKNLALSTQEHVVKLIRHIYNHATDSGKFNGKNPCIAKRFSKKGKFKYDNKRKRFLSREEADILLKELKTISPQTAQIATISLYTGMRLGEILSLKWSDIDFDNDIISVLDTKNHESRVVFITHPVKDVLGQKEKGEPHENVFVTGKGEPVKFLSNTFGRVVDKLGLNDNISDRRQRISFHTMRHTYASWAVQAGVPLYQVGKALGHKSTTMTERYSHLAPDSQRVAFEAVANYKI